MNSCNVPINKTGQFIAGITNGKIAPCDGYIAKLHRRAAKTLEQFREDLKALMVTQPILYWDDTVIMINKQRGCLRFYGNERIAWYAAHERKDLEGIMNDEVLQDSRFESFFEESDKEDLKDAKKETKKESKNDEEKDEGKSEGKSEKKAGSAEKTDKEDNNIR